MILVAGDSYCAQIDEGSWPYILSNNLNMPIVQCSNSGGSWWATRRSLMKAKQDGKFNDVKIVIFCHTEGTRIPNVDDIPICSWQLDHRSSHYDPDVLNAAKLYYKYLYDPDFALWVQQSWLNECANLFPNDTTIIHLHSFPYSYNKLKVTSGINVFPPLFAITQAEFDTDDEAFGFIMERGDPRKNHLNEHNNRALGNELTKIINTSVTNGLYNVDLSNFYIKNIEVLKKHSLGTGDVTRKNKVL